jgi:hypothetical protein
MGAWTRITGALTLGRGLYRNEDGYLRVSKRGPWRAWYAHRAYAARQMRESGRELTSAMEVH